jgi:activator of 2-hydroxyglutaryl-CoA dehydratase
MLTRRCVILSTLDLIDLQLDLPSLLKKWHSRVTSMLATVHKLLARKEVPVPSEVVLCGGGGKLRYVQEALEDVFPGRLVISEMGQEAVACGAAVAASLVRKPPIIQLLSSGSGAPPQSD